MSGIEAGVPERWEPLILPAELREQLAAEYPDLMRLKDWVLTAYALQTGIQLHPKTATPIQYTQLAAWLGFHSSHGNLSFNDVLLRKWRRLQFLLFTTYNGKADTISWRRCQICRSLYSDENSGELSRFVIRITPISRQAVKKKVFKAFQSALKSRFAEAILPAVKDGGICIALTFILSNKRKDKDVDNMCKALIDGFSRAIGFNDSLVHHLDGMKLRFPCDEEYLYIRVARSYLNNHADVLAPVLHHSWAGMELINLADYMPTD